MDNAAIKKAVKDIGKKYDGSKRLSRNEINFLKSLTKKQKQRYRDGHRILGNYYYDVRNYKLQRKSLEIATKRGRYRSDPLVLLSLSQCYLKIGILEKSIKTLRRTESKMGRMSGSDKINVYRTYGEVLRAKYLRQRKENPLQADKSLIDQAIVKWKRVQTMSAGGRDSKDAQRRITELEKLKAE
jgi:tetratricopeptide (TPR) repeat protein